MELLWLRDWMGGEQRTGGGGRRRRAPAVCWGCAGLDMSVGHLSQVEVSSCSWIYESVVQGRGLSWIQRFGCHRNKNDTESQEER